MAKKRLRVALVFGGTSKEREVSLESAKNIGPILARKYDLIPIEIDASGKWLKKIDKARSKIDVAFLALHGPGGEDGTVQGMLELLGIKYTCSGVLASAVAMSKDLTKRLVASEGVNVAPHILIERGNYKNDPKKYLKKLHGKLVVKPNQIGSSIGVTISASRDEIRKGIENAFKHDREVMIEPYIAGRELTVPVLGNRNPEALPVIEIVPKVSEFFDYRAKYETGGSDEIVPAPIPKALTNKLQNIAVLVHKLLGCRGITRSDFIVTAKGQVYFLEINTIPGMTGNSLAPKSAKAAGMPFPDFLAKLINLALDKE